MSTQSPSPLEWHVGIPESVLTLPGLDVRSLKAGLYFYGETPNPTSEDGWLISGRVVQTRQGITIEALKIEPSPWIYLDGKRRKRRHLDGGNDINSSVIDLIDLTRIRETVRHDPDVQRLAAMADNGERIREIRRKNEADQKERRVNTPDFLYSQAQDVLQEVGKGSGIRDRLAKRWGVSTHTVKFRMKLLRSQGWIDGGSTKALPGPTYSHYQATLETNTQKEQA